MEPVILPIEDVLDLHLFQPKEIASLICDYISECRKKGFSSVRIIHGKGKGVQKARVQSLLKNNPDISSFCDAPPEAGGWGATLVQIRPR